MTVNVENITRVQDAILGSPGKFDMNHWCDSAMCIGGWANHLQSIDEARRIDSERAAAEFLGMDREDADELFYPETLYGDWSAITPEQAVAHLEHIKAGGDVDWPRFTPELVDDPRG